jgi:hypothetical protein
MPPHARTAPQIDINSPSEAEVIERRTLSVVVEGVRARSRRCLACHLEILHRVHPVRQNEFPTNLDCTRKQRLRCGSKKNRRRKNEDRWVRKLW